MRRQSWRSTVDSRLRESLQEIPAQFAQGETRLRNAVQPLLRQKSRVFPSTATMALAIGALAIGAFAVGFIAIGGLSIGRARIGRLDVGSLTIRRRRRHYPEPENEDDIWR